MNERCLSISLVTGLAMSSAALIRLSIWKANIPAPKLITVVSEASLKEAGWLPANQTQAISTPQLATGPGRIYSTQAGSVQQLSLTPVRVRGYRDLESSIIRQFINDGIKKPELTQTISLNRERLLLGTDRTKQTLEGCLVDKLISSRAYSLAERLRKQQITFKHRLQVIAGQRQPREWECLFVRLTIPNQGKQHSSLENAWTEIRPRLKSSSTQRSGS